MLEFQDNYIFPEYLLYNRGRDYQDIHAQSSVGLSLLSTLGSYWNSYYEDMDNLHLLSGSITSLVGAEYQAILQQVISSSIIDIPVHHEVPNQLFAFNSKDAVYIRANRIVHQGTPINVGGVPLYAGHSFDYIEFNYPGLEGIQYLSEALAFSNVVLVEGEHYTVEEGVIRFYVDIFSDKAIQDYVYTYTSLEITRDPQKVVILWASDVSFTETYLYDRYGRYLYSKQINSAAYKATLTALQYFFTNTKSIKSLEAILNILFNLPYARTPGEQVVSLDTLNAEGEVVSGAIDYNANALADTPQEIVGNGWYTIVTTTHNVYYSPAYTELLVGVGDVLGGYQLICRLHRAKDYISDAEWYKDTRFPFELMEDISDYSKLTTPPEFERYVPHRFDGEILMSGAYLSTGKYGVHNGINPFLNTRSKSEEQGGSEFEQLLYGLVDTILKYNLIHVYTELNYDNIDYFRDNNIDESYKAIADSVPAYLYPIMETLFRADLADKFDDLREDLGLQIATHQEDTREWGDAGICDGSKGFSNPEMYYFNGEYLSDGTLNCSPYGGTGAEYAKAEIERENLALTLTEQEGINVLGFGDDPTFPRNLLYHTMSGLNYTDGSVAFGLYTEEVEASDLQVGISIEDQVDSLRDESTILLSAQTEEYFGGCDGTAGFNNVTHLTCGSRGITHFNFNGVRAADGSVLFSHVISNPSAISSFDGRNDLKGWVTTGWTCGSNVPPYVSTLDTLDIVITRKEL